MQTELFDRCLLPTGEALRNFMLAGNAVFTIKSLKTGKHFTYKVSAPEKRAMRSTAANFQGCTGKARIAPYIFSNFRAFRG